MVPPAAGLTLEDPVTAVPGVGTKAAGALRSPLEIRTVRDLIEHYPRRYEDLGDVLPLRYATVGEPVTLIGTVTGWMQKRPRGRKLVISEARVRDRDGAWFTVTYFNQPWRERSLGPGTVASFSGKLETFRGDPKISTPDVQVLGHEDQEVDHQRLIPVYPATESTPTWKLQTWIAAALEELPPLDDPLPEALRDGHGLVSLDSAIRGIHAPDDATHADASRRRLVFDELFTLQVGLQWRRVRLEAGTVGKHNGPVDGGKADAFLDSLPFTPTDAQSRAFTGIGADLAADRPMHRLLQGDVGSGKTLVAAWAMLCAVDRRRQAALMVPTAVLAEQHHRTLTDLLAPLGVNVLDGVRVELLTAANTTRERRRILSGLLTGEVDIVVGTHALLEEGVRFADLGLVVIDEQHRFGVNQRVTLREKGEEGQDGAVAPGDRRSAPDILVMTATPIPRSLALTLYGDLDVTTLDELPPGRKPIVTQLITPDEAFRRERLYDFIRGQAADGYQTYIVCPLVEDSEEVAARAAETEVERLREGPLAGLDIELVHGRMRPDDKELAMQRFRRGDADVLVSTTVIEVGVDVPNATVMVIENAERFGISQLHQLRGRVGRGGAKSYCVLFAGWDGDGELTDEASERLHAVAASTDGFVLARTDLDIRGEGALFGQRQSGLPDLKLARLSSDLPLIEETRGAAQRLVAEDPDLRAADHRALRADVLRRYRGGLEELDALATG
ncbi:MAG TPA: ATP-dependent DNA helicase RecG [Nitriliruptorales bacterium]